VKLSTIKAVHGEQAFLLTLINMDRPALSITLNLEAKQSLLKGKMLSCTSLVLSCVF